MITQWDVASFALLLVIAGCERESAEPVQRSAASASAAPNPTPTAASSAPDVLRAPPEPTFPRGELGELRVEGFGAAVVSYPKLGPLRTAPLIVALHGNFDRPEWQCEAWASASGGRALVLCPRGQPRPDTPERDRRYTYDSYARLKAEVARVLEALSTQWPQYQASERTLVGFSLGANMGAQLLLETDVPAFAHVVLIEGGAGRWSTKRIARYVERGGGSVLFACGQSSCAQAARRTQGLFSARGVHWALVATAAGHTYVDAVQRGIAQRWAVASANEPTVAPGRAVERQ